MIRPRVALPTGTEMGAPVDNTGRPRFKPSDVPMAIVRTTPSPSCCCTSSVSPTSCSFSASYTWGMDSRGNCTSMTAPMIWVILPSAILSTFLGPAAQLSSGSKRPRTFRSRYARHKNLDRSRAAHDLRKLFRDRGLAGLVVDQLQFADELAGVVGGGLHGDHACGHFRSHVLD